MIDALKSAAQEQAIPWQTLLKEALQVLFLEAFYSLPEASQATFQGGTCLRLLYGAPRHSEDLDFVTTRPLESWEGLRSPVFQRLKGQESLLQGTLEMTAQRSFAKILRWKLKWKSAAADEGVFVRIELASFPAHTRELKPLLRPPGLPTGSWVVVPAESREEILADKLTAVAGRPYLKGRDFFDLWFLSSQGVSLNAELVKAKLRDYSTSPEGFLKRRSEVDETVLRREMRSFLPRAVRDHLEAEGYRSVLKVSRELLEQAQRAVAA